MPDTNHPTTPVRKKVTKVYGTHGRPGCVQLHRTRGGARTWVAVYNSEQAGLPTDEGRAPWSVVCELHGTVLRSANLSEAREHATEPQFWCERCMASAQGAH